MYIISVLTIIFFVLPTLLNKVLGGYLNYLIMFIDLYLIGAYFRLHGNILLDQRLKLIGIMSYIIIAVSIIVFDYKGSFDEFYTVKKNIMVFPYNGSNFFVLLTAISIFIWFKNFKMKVSSLVNTIAATTFAIYLIHDNGLISKWIWNSIICGWKFYESNFLVLHMITSCCVLFLICAAIEAVRIRYFEKPLMNKLKKYI